MGRLGSKCSPQWSERDEGRRYILGVSKNLFLERKKKKNINLQIYSYFTYTSVGRRSEWFDISDDYYYHPQPKKETLYLPHRKKTESDCLVTAHVGRLGNT